MSIWDTGTYSDPVIDVVADYLGNLDGGDLSRLALVFALLLAFAGVVRSGFLHRTWREARERLLWGLPIGTAVIVAVNVAFFLFVQRGLDHPGSPLYIPFISWSYLYPEGVLSSAIAHANSGHITGNMMATVVFAPLAEYVVGHRGSRHPYLRALVFVPLLWYVFALVPAAFAWGPGLGFSGAVFAFFGFVVVFYPVRAVLMVVLVSVAGSLFSALVDPISIQVAGERFVRPSWANVAIDAHVIGLLLGFGVAALYARRYRYPIERFRVGFALVSIAVLQGLWIFAVSDGSRYVLYQAAGKAVVVTLGVGLTYAASELADGPMFRLSEFSAKRMAAGSLLVVPLAVFVVVGVWWLAFFGALGFEQQHDGVEVGDYEVFYGEDVAIELAPPFDELLDETPEFSGVVVSSDTRGIRTVALQQRQLSSSGNSTVKVGGFGWMEEVEVERTSMTSATGNSTYTVELSHEGSGQNRSYDSGAADAETVVEGWDVSLEAVDGRRMAVLRGEDRVIHVSLVESSTVTEGVELWTREGRVFAEGEDSRAVVGRVD